MAYKVKCKFCGMYFVPHSGQRDACDFCGVRGERKSESKVERELKALHMDFGK